jgi:ubiquitin C-terminal hydrolase
MDNSNTNLTKYMDNYDKTKGCMGLANLGNTCFLNSCIQVINHIYELNEIYDVSFHKNKKHNIPETIFFKEWVDFHKLLWSNDGIICPNKFIKDVQILAQAKNRDLFTGFLQNDIHEFILLFIETLHSSISRKIHFEITGTPENTMDTLAIKCYTMLQQIYSKEYSEFMELFYGISISKITNMDGTKTHSTTPESFFILDLPIPTQLQEINIYDCMDLFVKYEIMDGENAWFNEKTGVKENIRKNICFWNFPKILIISLKRFSPCGRFKRDCLVNFPMSLNLSKYVCGYFPSKYKYNLFGVCNHYGNTNGGHYTAFVCNHLNEWMHFNDTFVEKNISFENVVTSSAYCLFYRLQ